MTAARILVTLVIIFVGLNLILIIYNSLKREVREGFDHKNSCPKGCSRGGNVNSNCSDRVLNDGDRDNYTRECHYHCPGPHDMDYNVDQECDSNKECNGCGTYHISTDANGYATQSQNTTGLVAANEAPKYSQIDGGGGDGQERNYSGSYTAPNNVGVDVNENDALQAESTETETNGIQIQSANDSIPAGTTDVKPWKTYTTGTDTANAQLANADDQTINKKRGPIYEKSSEINTDTVPQTYTNTRTTNMLSYNPIKNNLNRKEGYAFSGSTIGDDSSYTDLMTASEECNMSVLCAGLNFDITSGQYSLMSVGGKLIPRRGYVAYVKKPSQYGGVSTRDARRGHKQKGVLSSGDDMEPVTWTLVASITPSFGNIKNNTLSNGSLSSNAASYAVPDVIKRDHYQRKDDHNNRYEHRRDDYYNDNRGEHQRRDERYEAPDAEKNKTTDLSKEATQSLTSGKPPATPYTRFAHTNKPRNPYLKPRPYNSLMDLFR